LIHSFLGCAGGHLLQYARDAGMDPVGIEAFTDPAEFLPNLKIIQANAADNKVLVPLIKQAFYILWNGILFEQNAGPVLVSLETYSRYSTIIMTNVELNEPRADSKVQFKIFGPERTPYQPNPPHQHQTQDTLRNKKFTETIIAVRLQINKLNKASFPMPLF
jgi:hypothetical protein